MIFKMGTRGDFEELRLTQKVIKELHERLDEMDNARFVAAMKRQRLAAKAGGEAYHVADGEIKMRVDPYFYHRWGQRLGYECWSDKQFVDEILRDNPETRVKSRSRKIQVGWAPSDPRFHKEYDAA